MEIANLVIILCAVLFGALLCGVWVAAALFLVAFVALTLNGNDNIGLLFATTTWGASATWTLAALPLFIWMGEILFRTRLSEELFHGLAPWLKRIPGRLLHVNILSCAIFAAVSGSSAATAATIGRMTVPELRRRRYPAGMIIGTLAGSGTLGFLIPPSIILIVYGVSAEISIARLFIAGVLPGVMLVTLFMGYTALWAIFNAGKLPGDDIPVLPFRQKLRATRRLFPVLGLILFVLGSIYAGWATATEAAAIGVLGALALSLVSGTLNAETFTSSLLGATRTSCMIIFIIAGAAFLSLAMGFTGIPRMLAEQISALGLSPVMLIIALTLFFMLLGCFLDGISIVILTTTIVLPMIEGSGIDPIWFGVYVVLVVEMSQITPPVGFNLFVIQGLTKIDILKISRHAVPFFLLLMAAIAILGAFPQLATWLPMKMTQ